MTGSDQKLILDALKTHLESIQNRIDNAERQIRFAEDLDTIGLFRPITKTAVERYIRQLKTARTRTLNLIERMEAR